VLRALHAALGMQRAFTAFAGEVQQTHRVALMLQCGVHTGPVLVGEIDQELQLTYTAPGATVQVATALQQLSQGSAIVVSDAVQHQATGFFRFTPLGLQSLPEIPEPVRVYICTGVGAVTSRLEGALARGRTAFHGRQQELALLAACWARVCQGTGQVVCVIGEAGVGKSRLAYECRRTSGGARWLTMQALSYGQTMPYQALLPLVRTLFGIAETDDPAHQRQAIRTHLLHLSPALPEAAPLLMHMLGVPLESETLPALSPEVRRRRLLHACEQLILQQTSQSPVCLLVEDGHWLDPSSRALLDALVASLARRPLLVLCTARPGFRHTWADYTYFHRVTVEPLAAEAIDALVRDLLRPYDASATLQALIRQRTGGNPFFVEELVRAMQAHALLTLQGTVYELAADQHLALPASVQGIVQARLDRLPAEAKHLLQMASVIGPEVALPLLQGLAELPEDALPRHMKHLQTAELLYEIPTQPLPIYTFKHMLVQEAAYQMLDKPTRQYYHQQITQLLARCFPETLETQPELLAHHYTEAGQVRDALPYWQRAGQRAVERSAHVEAISHLTQCLKLLQSLPETPERLQQELSLLIALGVPLVATRGYAAPEVAQVYRRACTLSSYSTDPVQHLLVLRGLESYYLVRGEAAVAQDLGKQLLTLAYQQSDPAHRVTAHLALGQALHLQGVLPEAREHIEQGLALYDPQHHRYAARFGGNPGITCALFAALILWLQGHPDQALRRCQTALAWAQELALPSNLALTLSLAAMLHHYRREPWATRQHASAAVTLSAEQEFPLWAAVGTLFHGWAVAAQGQEHEGLPLMRQGLQVLRATGAGTFLSYTLAVLAEIYGKIGQPEDGLRLLAEALTWVEQYGVSYHAAELYRLHGELLLLQDGTRQAWEGAEASFRNALALARQQHARALELRAAVSLGRLWHLQGKPGEAQRLVGPIYHWFTEGFDTADLHAAKALLEDLS
jgi:adenylate cyclase